jgi:hypothetical protein
MSHSLCSRNVSASRNDGPSSRSSRGCRFQALLDLVVLAAGSYTHLDQTSGGVELLVRPACACSQVPDARARPFARARAGRVMHSRHRALWVPVDGRHEVFALSGPRVARPVDGGSAHSKNALKPRSSRSQFARSPRFSPPLRCPATEAAAAPDTPFLTCAPALLSPVPLAVVTRPACRRA